MIKKCINISFYCYTSQKMARTRTTQRRTRRTYTQTKVSFQVIKRYRTQKVQALEKAQKRVLELPAPSDEPSEQSFQAVKCVSKMSTGSPSSRHPAPTHPSTAVSAQTDSPATSSCSSHCSYSCDISDPWATYKFVVFYPFPP